MVRAVAAGRSNCYPEKADSEPGPMLGLGQLPPRREVAGPRDDRESLRPRGGLLGLRYLPAGDRGALCAYCCASIWYAEGCESRGVMATTHTPIRLTAEDRAQIADLPEWTGLPSRAAVVRSAVHGGQDGFVVALREGGLEPAEARPAHPHGERPAGIQETSSSTDSPKPAAARGATRRFRKYFRNRQRSTPPARTGSGRPASSKPPVLWTAQPPAAARGSGFCNITKTVPDACQGHFV